MKEGGNEVWRVGRDFVFHRWRLSAL